MPQISEFSWLTQLIKFLVIGIIFMCILSYYRKSNFFKYNDLSMYTFKILN